MKFKRNIFFLLAFLTLGFSSCQKENDNPQWDVGVLAPLVKSTLNISNLINDTLLQSDTNHILHVVYEKNLYDLNLDSLVNIPDTSIQTTVSYPISFLIPAGLELYNHTTQLSLGISGPQIRFTILRHGMLTLKAVNHLTTKLYYVFKIPGAVFNADTLFSSGTIDAALPGDSVTFETSFDLSGYNIDLTGTSGATYNTISYLLVVNTDPLGGSVMYSSGTPALNLYETFSDIFPEYVKGYLGSDTITEGPSITAVDIFKKIQSGVLNLADAKLTCTIDNGIGADGRFIVNDITSVNNRTGTNVPLVSSQLINHSININRASETGITASPVNTTQNIFVLNTTNSNILPFIENLPDELSYTINLYTNPIPPGNISGNNDFVFADHLISTKMRFEMPLSFSSDYLTFADTADFISNPGETFGDFRSGTLKLIADNGFPFQAFITLSLLDENLNVMSTLTSSGIIASALVDANGRVNARVKSIVNIPVSETQMEALKKTKKIISRASFTTSQYPVLRNIYDDYSIQLKLIADFTYMIH